MERQFNLILTNRWKATGLIVVICVVSISLLLCILGIFEHHPVVGIVLGIMWVIALAWLPTRIARRFGADSATVVFDEAGMTVSYATTGVVQRLNFIDVASFYEGLSYDFTVQPRQGKALVFHLNEKLHPQGVKRLTRMQRYFRQAIIEYQLRQPDRPPIRRLNFFDSSWATWWLLFFAAMLMWKGWGELQQPIGSESQWGKLALGSLVWGVYAMAWRHYRKRA